MRLINVPSRSTVTVTVSPAASAGLASRPCRPQSSARHPPPQVPDPSTSPGSTQVPRDACATISPHENAIEAKVSWPIWVPLTDAVMGKSKDLAARADSSSSGVTSTGPNVVAVSFPFTGPSRNTVYLRGHDWAAVQRWGVAVVGVFELVVRHVAFDDSRVGARAARGEQLMEDFGGDADFGVADHLRGKNQGGLQWFGGLPEVIG